MTAPSGAPGLDPAAPPVNPTPAPGVPAPAPQPTGQPGPDPNAPVDVNTLPANVQKLIADLRNEAAGHRQGKATEAQRATDATTRLEAVLKAAGFNPDGSAVQPSPEQLVAQMRQQAEAAEEYARAQEDKAWSASLKFQLHRTAGQLGADPDALLDSGSFIDSLDDIADDDPDSEAFRTALAVKVREALKANPRLAAQRGGPTRMGADITGSGGGNTGRPRSLREAFSRK